jgi:hypothetical protein
MSERCPGCGEPWEDVPLGHSVAHSLNGDPPTCDDVARPVSPEEFMCDTADHLA